MGRHPDAAPRVCWPNRTVASRSCSPKRGCFDALADVAVATGYGRAAVPRSGYGRREIEGMPVVEDLPRLVGQLMLLARGLLALGLDRRRVLGMCTWAALHSIPGNASPSSKYCCRPDGGELAVAEIARRAGCHRQAPGLRLRSRSARWHPRP